jgi:ribosomal protein S6--L-glutamate ligase
MEIALLSFPHVLPENLASLRRAAEIKGFNLKEIEPTQLSLLISVESSQVLYQGQAFNPQVILHRTVAKFMHLVKPILEALEAEGTIVINDPTASIASRSKLETAQILQKSKLPFLDSQFQFSGEDIRLDLRGAIVSKPVLGAQGRGIQFHENSLEASQAIQQSPKALDNKFVEPILIQSDLGENVKDYRAHVVDGKCVALMQRIPEPGKRLANLAQGGIGEALELTHPAAGLAESAAQAMKLDIAGVDLLGIDNQIYISEVDAWAGFAGIEKVTGKSVSDAIFEMIERRLK